LRFRVIGPENLAKAKVAPDIGYLEECIKFLQTYYDIYTYYVCSSKTSKITENIFIFKRSKKELADQIFKFAV
jgi:hypothetical protein